MPTRQKHRIFLIDDHPLVREGLGNIINQQKDMLVCGEAESGKEALRKLTIDCPDIAIVDLSLGDISGLDLIGQINEALPSLPLLVLSMHEGSIYAERALKAGARGYIDKQESAERVLDALRHILAGQIYLGPSLTTKIINRFTGTTPPCSIASLSNRELEVFQLLGEGLTRSSIAKKLSLSAKTIDTHCTNIKEKLGLQSTTQLVQQATLLLHQENISKMR